MRRHNCRSSRFGPDTDGRSYGDTRAGSDQWKADRFDWRYLKYQLRYRLRHTFQEAAARRFHIEAIEIPIASIEPVSRETFERIAAPATGGAAPQMSLRAPFRPPRFGAVPEGEKIFLAKV
jgi:hypothetical protein